MKTPLKKVVLGCLTLLVGAAVSHAANLTWDANTAVTGAQDGSGTWDATTAGWWTGSADAVFSSVTPDVPTIGNLNGTAGTITLGANVVAANVTFSPATVGYYTIAGGGFTLGLTNRTVTPNVNATLSANMVGVGVSLANSASTAPSAVLTLSGNNTYTNFNLGANVANTTAAVRIAANNALGLPSGSINIGGGQGNITSHRIEITGGISLSNNVTVAGRNIASAAIVNLSSGNTIAGTWTRTTGGADLHIDSEAANGLTFSGSANANGFSLSSTAGFPRNYVLRGSGGGTVSGIITNGTSTLGIVKAGSGTWTFSGANNFTNGTVVDEGTLTLDYSSQNNSKIAVTGPLTLGGGTVNLSGGSFVQVVGSTIIGAGNPKITRGSGTSTLRMQTITRNRGGVTDFGAASIADCNNNDVNGILGGGYATIAGADWAHTVASGAANTAITAYTGYTDIAASGSTVADSSTSNIRLNSAGGGGNISLGAATTTINSLLQNTTTVATINTSAGTLRLGAIGGVLLPSTAQSLTFGTSANSGTLTAGGAANTAGEILLINNSANALMVNSTIADNGTGPVSLTKAGSGSATLAGNNAYTGTNAIVGGTLNVSDDSNFGAVPGSAIFGDIQINGGALNATTSFTLNANRGITVGPTSRYGNGTISVAGGQTLTYNGIIANADTTGSGPGGSLTKTGNGTLILGGANTYTFGTIINGGTVSITASGNLGALPGCYIPDYLVVNGGTLEAANTLTLGAARGVVLGPVGGSGNATFQPDSGASLQLDSRIADNWNGTGSLIVNGAGTLILTSGFNDYSGNTTVTAGTLQINNPRSIPNGAGKGNVTVNGTLALNNTNAAINGLSGSGIVDNIGGSAVTFSVGNNNQTSAFSGTIQNSGGGPLTLNKNGSGTLTFSGTGNHTGSTTITGGTLALTGSATMPSTTNIAISAGATLDVSGLSGGGTLTLNSGESLTGFGSVLGTINTGTGVLAPGASAGTLTVANLTLGSGSSINYDLANVTTVGGGTNDYTIVTSAMTVAGPVTLNLNYLNGIPASSGKYTLFSYGSFSGDVTQISVPSGFQINNNTSAKTIELLIVHTPSNLTWRGDGSSDVWDINTTPNWILSGSAVTFFNGDTANFDNTGSNSPPIYVASPVVASAVNVNATQTYDFTGSSVAAATLLKNGSGTLIFEDDNSYPNGVNIAAGTLQIGNGGSTGTLTSGNITNNGAIVADQTGDIVLSSPISGGGSISVVSSGTLALSASNSYAGATTVTSGRLYARNLFALGATNTGTAVASGAQIYLDQNVDIAAEPLTLNGSGLNSAGDGALRKGGAGLTTFYGPITMGSDTTINIDGSATLNLTNASGIFSSSGANLTLTGGAGSAGIVNGPITLGSGGGVLNMTSSGSWTLGGSNSMSLATVGSGALILANKNALGTNLLVVLTSTTGGAGLSGTRLTLSGGLNIPANRSLTMPSSGAGAVRSAFFSTGANTTNTWAGSMLLTGDSSSSGNVISFGVDANSTFTVTGNVNSDSTFLAGKLILRGTGGGASSTTTGLGLVTGNLVLDPANGQLQVDDGTTWVLSGNGNTWLTTIISGNSTLRLGANNALPTATLVTVGNSAANRLDLAGFNQTVAGLGAAGINITNSSATSDSTLTYSSGGAQTTFGSLISDGTRKLNLTIATGNLTLTNPATLNLTKSTISVASGAVLEMDYTGTNTVNAFVTNGISAGPGLYSVANAAPYLASSTGTAYLLVQPGPSGPALLTNSVSGNTLSLSWPPGVGWRLQAQTNSLSAGLNPANWTYVTDGSVSSTNITIVPVNPTTFFRLRYP